MIRKSISVIVPAYNEVESLPQLVKQLTKTLAAYDKWEVLIVDDGSTDGTMEYLSKFVPDNERFIYMQFHRNYGKSAALAEGFKHAQGDYIVTMDADLQDDPAEIPNLIKKLEEGYDLVSGWKADRKDPWTKTIPSRIFNTVTRLMTGVKIHDFNCGLKIYRSNVVKSLDVYGGRHRYIPALAGQKRFRISEIAVNHRPRQFGESKYGGVRLFHGFFDLITILFLRRYTQQPLHLFGAFGLIGVLVGGFIDLYVVYLKYIGGEPFQKHMALLVLGIFIVVIGIQFFSLGLLGELMAGSQQRSENRVKRIIGIK